MYLLIFYCFLRVPLTVPDDTNLPDAPQATAVKGVPCGNPCKGEEVRAARKKRL